MYYKILYFFFKMSHNNSIKFILDNKELLLAISKCKTCMRKAIINKSDKKLVNSICEMVFNLINGNLSINNSDFQKLKKYKTSLRKLVKKSNLASKKKILVQNGGFLQFLIPAVITGISEIVSSLISKKSSDN